MDATLRVQDIYKQHEDRSKTLGMIVALISFLMLFASLFLGYAVFRFQNQAWPPMGFEKVSLLLPTISSVFIVLSSVTYHLAYIAFGREKKNLFNSMILLTVILAGGFLATQFQLWSYLSASGLYVESGIFASILHAFTWVHAAHVALAILGLVYYILPICFAKTVEEKFYSRILNVGKFWHFLGIVWILMFVFIFAI